MADDFKSLIKSAKKGNKQSFAKLYSEIYEDLYRYAYYTLRCTEDAEDCVSEAVIDAYRTIGNLKSEEAFKSWFFKILSVKCKRKIKEYYKKPPENLETSTNFKEIDENLDLQKALFSLSPDERMIISLTVFGGYKSKEISKILKINQNTVRSKYSRALEKMRIMIEI